MEKIIFSDKLKQDRKLYPVAVRANERLKQILGKSEFAASVSGEWDLASDEHGNPVITLRLRDDLSETTGSFPPWYLQDDSIMRSSVWRLWDDLLKVRLDVQHAKVVKLVEALDGD